MTRARWRGAVLTGTAVCCLALVGAWSATAATSSRPAAAYWWQPEPVSGLIPVPGVASDGLYVASSANGPQAESAVRFQGPNPGATVKLTLHVASNAMVGNPAVLGYPAASRWSSGGPQPWSSRPSYRSQATPAHGVFHSSGSGQTMTIEFPASEAVLGIVLVPAGSGNGGQPPTFSVAFDPPQSRDVAVDSTSSARSTPSSHGTSTPHRPASSGGPSHGAGGSPSATASHHAQSGGKATPQHGASTSSGPSSSATAPSTTAGAGTTARSARSVAGSTVLVIVAVGILAGCLLVLVGWRAARRG